MRQAMRDAAGDERYSWSFAGSRRLKGISSEVRTFRARTAEPRDTD